MADIRTRDLVKRTVKTIDKASIATEKIKNTTIKAKGEVLSDVKSDENSPEVYASNKVSNVVSKETKKTVNKGNVIGKKSAEISKNNILKKRQNSKNAKQKKKQVKGRRKIVRNIQGNQNLSKTRYRKNQSIAKIKGKKTSTGKKAKKIVKAFLKSIRDIALSTKAVVIGLTAGGWIAVVMILVTIFVAGTINVIDMLSVDPKQEGMDEWDKKYLEEILEEYPNGYIGVADGNIVNVALSQVGNVGGRRFWYWYGFRTRVEWCCCFVSWCADQCGYIKDGIIPKFSCTGDGANFFQKRGEWQGRFYVPKPGQIIFFRWYGDAGISHVGIVKSCDGKNVYTIEGNSGDMCKERTYPVGSACIVGYGCPKYPEAKDKKGGGKNGK